MATPGVLSNWSRRRKIASEEKSTEENNAPTTITMAKGGTGGKDAEEEARVRR